MSFFVHAQGIKTVLARGRGVEKWQNSVHVVAECPLTSGEYTSGQLSLVKVIGPSFIEYILVQFS